MPAPAWDNLDEFLDLDDFATRAVIHFQRGGTRPVTGIFDDPYLMAAAGGYERDQVKPTFQLKETDGAGAHIRDWIVIGADTFDILTGPQGDGNGMAILMLAKR